MSLDSLHLTETIASFALDTDGQDLPPAALRMGKELVLDTLGVALAACPRPIGRIITQFIADEGRVPADATVLGTGFRTSAAQAALANGALANALDYDGGFHHSTYILPVALALAEHRRLSGREVLDAVVIGFEIGSRLQQTMDGARDEGRGPTSRGWWHIKLSGPLAAALTGARLLKLDRRRAAMAVGIASCSSGGFRRNFGTMAKALHSGYAARDGIEAALLAERGFTADPAILESPLGFLGAVCRPDEIDVKAITERLGKPYGLEKSHALKDYPACSPAHSLIDAALALCGQGGFAAEEIGSVEADLHPFSLLRSEPADEEAAGFSGAFIVAATLIHGAFGLRQCGEEVLDDPRVRALMKRIKHVPSAGEGIERMTIRLGDGRELAAEVPSKTRRLIEPEAIAGKFLACAQPVLGRGAAEELRDLVLDLERQPALDRLMALAGGAGGRARS